MYVHLMEYPVVFVHADDDIFYMYVPFVRKVAFIQEPCHSYVHRRGSIMHDDHKTIAVAEQYLGVLRYVYDSQMRCGLNPVPNACSLEQFERVY